MLGFNLFENGNWINKNNRIHNREVIMATLCDKLYGAEFGVKIVCQNLEDFHLCINTPTNDESYFIKLKEYLDLCLASESKRCFFHVVTKPCSTFVGRALLFYKDFCKDHNGHEMVVVYYDNETKGLLTALKLDQIFSLWSKKEFERVV